MTMSKAALVALLTGALLFLAAGCGRGPDPTATPEPTRSGPHRPPTPTPAPEAATPTWSPQGDVLVQPEPPATVVPNPGPTPPPVVERPVRGLPVLRAPLEAIPAIVYVGFSRKGGRHIYGYVDARDPRTGDLLWRYEMTAEDWFPASLELVGDVLYVMVDAAFSTEPHVHALDMWTGEFLWRGPIGFDW